VFSNTSAQLKTKPSKNCATEIVGVGKFQELCTLKHFCFELTVNHENVGARNEATKQPKVSFHPIQATNFPTSN
jgi:hypothetical protein